MRINIFCALFASLTFEMAILAQPAVELWSRQFNRPTVSEDAVRTAVTDPAGNVIVAGSSDAKISGEDWLLIKYSGAGVPLWTNRYDGPAHGTDRVEGISTDNDGNIIVSGSAAATNGGRFSTIKYSALGVGLWTNLFSTTTEGPSGAAAVVVDDEGNIIVTGSVTNISGTVEYLTIKYSSSGIPSWTNRYTVLPDVNSRPVALTVNSGGTVFVTGTSDLKHYATIAYSNLGVPLWTNIYPGRGLPASISTDANGDVVVTGSSEGPDGYPDYLTIKYSGAGTALWTNRYSGPPNSYSYDEASALEIDDSGNVFVTGYSNGRDDYQDFATIAYSSLGTPLWTNRYTGVPNGNEVSVAISTDSAGNVIVTGVSSGSAATGNELVTIKYSATGLPLWTRRLMGLNSVQAKSLAIGSNDASYIASSWAGSFLTVSYAANGVLTWTNRSNLGEGNGRDEVSAVAVDPTGNVIMTGGSFDKFGTGDFTTAAYSSSGLPLWTRHYNGPGNDDDFARDIAVDRSGNVFVTGPSAGVGSSYDFATIKYSAAGALLWTKRYNGTGNSVDNAAAIALAENGDVVVAGSSLGTIGFNGYFDFAVVKYSTAGEPLWTNRYNGPANNEDHPVDVAVDLNGNVIVAGYSYGPQNYTDYLTIKYSADGLPLWTNLYSHHTGNNDRLRALAVDSSGNIFVTGESFGTSQEFATVKYSSTGVALWTNRYPGLAGAVFLYAAAVDSAGNLFVTGADGGFGTTKGGFVTLKYSGAGVALWTNYFNGPVTESGHNDNGRAIAVDPSGNVFVTGQSYQDVGNSDFVTVAYSNSGTPLWTNRFNGPANRDDVPLGKGSIAVSPDGGVYVVGISDGDFSGNRIYDMSIVKYGFRASPPTLGITRESDSVVIKWLAAANGYRLYGTPSLFQPSWTVVPQTVATNDNELSVTLPIAPGNRFFRLQPE